jgi:hypothetical protein
MAQLISQPIYSSLLHPHIIFMEFIIRNIDFEVTEYGVTKKIAEVLHACPGLFGSDADAAMQQCLINVIIVQIGL